MRSININIYYQPNLTDIVRELAGEPSIRVRYPDSHIYDGYPPPQTCKPLGLQIMSGVRLEWKDLRIDIKVCGKDVPEEEQTFVQYFPQVTHTLYHKVLTYVEYRAVPGVFQNIDPPYPPLHPASVSSPRTKGALAGRWGGGG